MKKKYRYKSLTDTIIQIKNQAVESIPFCYEITEGISSPEQLFYFLKTLVTYKNDPPGIELVHTVESLFEKNFHGEPGSGDCDDFTVLSLACLYTLGITPFIVLSGNQKDHPTHIYVTFLKDGNYFVFDLTQTYFNQERKYKFNQILKTYL